MPDEEQPVTVTDVDVRAVRSDEYELAAVATAAIDGPMGPVRIRRRYEALPRHNDVVDVGALDANDELVDRSDVVQVHTRHYHGEAEEFVLDTRDTWTPDDLGVLESLEAFLASCHAHHVDDVGHAYARAAAEGQSL